MILGAWMVGAALTGLWTWELVAPFAQGTDKTESSGTNGPGGAVQLRDAP